MILFSLVVQGLTLPWLIRTLGVTEDGAEEEQEELRARLTAAKAALAEIDALEEEGAVREFTIERMRGLYHYRKRRFAARAGKIEDDGFEDRSQAYQQAVRRVLTRSAARSSSCATAARSPTRSCTGSSGSWTWRTPGWRSRRQMADGRLADSPNAFDPSNRPLGRPPGDRSRHACCRRVRGRYAR